MYKTSLKIVLIFTLFLNLRGAIAQVPTVYRADYNRMMAQSFHNMAHQNMMNMMMNRNWLNNANYIINPVYHFNVEGLDDSIRIISSKIYTDTLLHKTYLLTINRKAPKNSKEREIRTYVNETRSISRVNELGFESVGLATDSCWQFKVVSGKINAYSFLSETFGINTYYLCAFQIGNGPIQSLNPNELEKIISSSKKAKKAFDKKDFYKAILMFNKEKDM